MPLKVDSEFERIVRAKALELHTAGAASGEIDTRKLGALKLFIDEEPKNVLAVINAIDPKMAGKKIYVGSQT